MTLVPDRLDSFWAFVQERDRVYVRRAVGQPAPWTEDPVIRRYHFTNVHRRRDPGTEWIVARLDGTWPERAVLQATAYRMLNRVSTFEAAGLPELGDLDAWVDRVRALQRRGVPVGSARHMTFLGRTIRALETLVADPSIAARAMEAQTGVEIAEVLADLPGVKGFFAVQIAADLMTAALPDRRAPYGSASGLGVGARSALRLMEGESVEVLRQTRIRRALEDQTGLSLEESLQLSVLILGQPKTLSEPLVCIDLEHSLCEWSRYVRLASGDYQWATRMERRA